MTQQSNKALFVGLSKDEKAAAVLLHLSTEKEIGLNELMELTGMTRSQIHDGIRHLREAKPDCVITHHRGPDSTYLLATEVPDVRDYAFRRMKHWNAQVKVMQREMTTAIQLLPGAEARRVELAAATLAQMLNIIALTEEDVKLVEKRERELDRREAKLSARTSKSKRLAAVA